MEEGLAMGNPDPRAPNDRIVGTNMVVNNAGAAHLPPTTAPLPTVQEPLT
jgi:hypothetical protein